MLLKKIFFSICLLSFSKIVLAVPSVQKITEDEESMNAINRYEIHNSKCDYFSNRLVVIRNIEYYGFDREYHDDGEIIVLDVLANDVIQIFEELKKNKFPIYNLKITVGKKIVPRWPFGLFGEKVIDNEDIESLSGAYCCRTIKYTETLSLHSFGVAIDINTLQNPCVFIDEETQEIQSVVPKAGVMYLNRSLNRKGKENQDFGKINEKIVAIFKKHGYDIWGGYWDSPIDYQHFQVSTRKLTNVLIYADENDARKIFNVHKNCVNRFNKSLIEITDENKYDLFENYKNDKNKFMLDILKFCKIKTNVKTDARKTK